MTKQIGIIERAKTASSVEKLKQLEVEVKNYEFISAQTLARFRRAVTKRAKELENEPVV